MAYSGRYIVKNKSKYKGDPTTVVYRSLWEKAAFKWCDENKDVKYWSSEEVVIPYLYEIDKRYHRYFMDLMITYTNGKTSLIEIKPEKQTKPPTGNRRTKKYISEGYTYVKNINKWSAAEEYALDRGWSFEIWTEIKLRKMGILKDKPPGKLKPLKKMAPYRKKPKK
jgi:hypothetical protein